MDVTAHTKLHDLLANVESRILEKANMPFLAPELRLSTPAKWLYKYMSGSGELHELLLEIADSTEFIFLLKYVQASGDDFVIWEIEKECKTRQEWGAFIFSMIASCFAANLKEDEKWKSWASSHSLAWMDMYKPF